MHHLSKSPWIWIGPGGTFVTYVILNLCCVFIPFIPGPGAFIGFGILGPVVLAMIHCAWIYKKKEASGHWKSWAFAGALLYLTLGASNLYYITRLWASI
jgi:hypothetical protein